MELRHLRPVPPALRPETPIFDWAGETARRVGSLVHAELQSMRVGNAREEMIRSREPHYRRWLALHGVPVERLPEAASRVVEALLAVLADPRGRWILKRGYRDDFREHAVSGHWRGEIVRAVFDRSFIDENGVRWVIDYKTSRHSGGGLEEFLKREPKRKEILDYLRRLREAGESLPTWATITRGAGSLCYKPVKTG